MAKNRSGAAKKAKPKPGPARKPPAASRTYDWKRYGVIAAATLVVLLSLFVASARATDSSKFCGTCHEMQPFYNAWLDGKHHGRAECIDCHVDHGFFPRLWHKVIVLPEVFAHFTGDTKFPREVLADVPNSRCERCHPTVVVTNLKGFSHDIHARQGDCRTCHYNTGHSVLQPALEAAGIFNARTWALRQTMPAGALAHAGAGKANLPGHIPVVCSNCHDMAATPCSSCHTPPHAARGECSICHKPGPAFVFTHAPTTMPGWQNIACVKCHPKTYTQVYCTCHGGNAPRGGD